MSELLNHSEAANLNICLPDYARRRTESAIKRENRNRKSLVLATSRFDWNEDSLRLIDVRAGTVPIYLCAAEWSLRRRTLIESEFSASISNFAIFPSSRTSNSSPKLKLFSCIFLYDLETDSRGANLIHNHFAIPIGKTSRWFIHLLQRCSV